MDINKKKARMALVAARVLKGRSRLQVHIPAVPVAHNDLVNPDCRSWYTCYKSNGC